MNGLFVSIVMVVLVSAAMPAVASDNMIFIHGRITSAQTTDSLTTITPQTTTASNGSTTTQYAVISNETGDTLAVFATLVAAQTYAAQVTPQVAYR